MFVLMLRIPFFGMILAMIVMSAVIVTGVFNSCGGIGRQDSADQQDGQRAPVVVVELNLGQ